MAPFGCSGGLQVIYLRNDEVAHDALVWKPNNSGKFSVGSAYLLIRSDLEQFAGINWKRLWRIKCPQRCIVTAWMAIHNKLMTNYERSRRGFTLIDSCGICSQCEDTLHVPRDCESAWRMWSKILNQNVLVKFRRESIKDWFWMNISNKFVLRIGTGLKNLLLPSGSSGNREM